MYTKFFGLAEKPFSITPDPRYLYMSRRHTDALAHLIYGIAESGGFIQLTGEVGTGKTTLIRSLLEQLPAKADIALILNPQLTTKEFLKVICEELGAPPPVDDSVKSLIDSLNAHLLTVNAQDRRVVLIVDEAQTLSAELLEQVRLLTNLETAKRKLLQIILIGQPELRDLLAQPHMRQLAQRVTGRYHLEPLRADDTAAYVRHRLRVAGSIVEVFTRGALRQLYRHSRGIPRLINVIADRALLAGYTRERRKIDGRLVDRAAAEVFGTHRPTGRYWPWVAVAVGIASFVIATTGLWRSNAEAERAAAGDEMATAAPLATGGADDASLAAFSPAAAATPPAGGDGRPATVATPAALSGLEPASLATPANLTTVTAGTTSARAVAVSSTPRERPPGEAAVGVLTWADLLADPRFAGSNHEAMGALFGLWGASFDAAAGDVCAQAFVHGLTCYMNGSGTLAELEQLDRPAVLSLRDEGGRDVYAAVAGLAGDTATLRTGDGDFRVALADLLGHWTGEQLALERPATPPFNNLLPGVRAEGVVWLRESLARIFGEVPPEDVSPLYDASLEAKVREYQRARMLKVDGIVGTRTQTALLEDLGERLDPRLAASR